MMSPNSIDMEKVPITVETLFLPRWILTSKSGVWLATTFLRRRGDFEQLRNGNRGFQLQPHA